MLSPAKLWPFGLDTGKWRAVRAWVFVLFAVLLFADEPVTRMVNSMADMYRAPFYTITRAGASDWILIPSLIVALAGLSIAFLPPLLRQRDRIRQVSAMAGFVFCAVALPGIAALLIKRLFGRSRPYNFEEFGAFHFEPIVNGWEYQSFPSGDNTTIFAFATALIFLVPRLHPWVYAGAVLVGVSRIMVGAHYPTDVLAGMLLGTLGAYGVRNYWLSQGWVFAWNGDGTIARKPFALPRPARVDEGEGAGQEAEAETAYPRASR